MWTYNYSNENYLEHRLVNGRTVKYIARVANGKGGYRYFYTNEAYRGYLNRGKSTTRTLKDGTVRISKYGNKSSQTTAKTIKKPSVSKEYEEELAYNSKKNNMLDTSKKSSSTTSTAPRSASKEYWEAMGYDIDTLKYNSKTGQYELTEDSKKGTSKKSSSTTSTAPRSASKEYEEELAYNSKKNTTTNVSPKGPSTKTTSDGPVIFTVNKDTGKTELVSGTAEIVQKGKNLIEELLKKIGR